MAPPTTLLSCDTGAEAPTVTDATHTARGAAVYMELAKPGVTRLVVVTTLCGAAIAPGRMSLSPLIAALVGTTAVVAAANAFNMVMERDVDALMERTRGRPLPSGRLTSQAALTFGAVLAVLGLAVLGGAVNLLSAALAAGALASYVLIYTPMKRVSPWALHVGAIPGAVPPVIGWAAMTGSLDLQALSLFGILFVWQIPHFYAISIFRREDYAAANLKVLAVVKGVAAAQRATLVWAVALVIVSLTPVMVGLGGGIYAAVAAVSGVAFVLWILRGASSADQRSWARSTFFSSMPHLILLFGALVLAL